LPRAKNRLAAIVAVMAGLLALGIAGAPAAAAPERACLIGSEINGCFPEPPDQCPAAPVTTTGFVSRPLYSFAIGVTWCFTRLGDVRVTGGVRNLFTVLPPPFDTPNDGVLDFSTIDLIITDTLTTGYYSLVRTFQARVRLCDSVFGNNFPGGVIFECPAAEFPFIQIRVARGVAPVINTGVSSFPGIP
jgi:hypothetical protein